MAAHKLSPEELKKRNAEKSRKWRAAHPNKIRHLNARWHAAHREQAKEKNARWRAEHAAELKEKKARYHAKHRARLNEGSRRWRADHLDQARARIAAWQNEHREETRAAARNWRKAHPQEARTLQRNREARVRGAGGRYTVTDITRLFELQRGKCAGCGGALVKKGPGKYHIDHVLPVILGGTSDPSNLQLLCPRCNCSKQHKDPYEWAALRGKLFV